MNKPKISIITVCYNSEAHIEEAIQSVVNQPYGNKEYIIIDGGSKDHTMDIVNKYRDKIAYVVSEPDKGISDAFNKGIKVATGDVICICNSDDVIAEDVFTKFAEYYDGETDVYRLDAALKDFKTGEIIMSSPTVYLPVLPFTSIINHMGCYISKKAYIKYGLYDADFKYCMDLELLRRYTHLGASFKYVPVNCGYFRRGGASSSDERKMRNEMRLIITRHGGNKFQAEIFVAFFAFKQTIKKCLNVFGENTASRVRDFLDF